VSWQLCQVEAALTGDYNVALQALCADQTVPNSNVGRAILDRMLDIQKQYLPQSSQA
jgi:6-phospho-beta-glucosidase